MDLRRIVTRVSQGVIVVECAWVFFVLLGGDPRYPAGVDYRVVVDGASRWLHGAAPYLPYQLRGPYSLTGHPVTAGPMLYPPVAMWLFAPFAYLPAVLWWALPAGAVAWSFWRLRPSWWAWPLIAVLWIYPRAPEAVQNGNPVIWAFAAAMLGAASRWPAALVLMKPTLAPFALFGVRDRRWWVVLGLGIAAALPFGSLWMDYVRAVSNVQAGTSYLLHDWPLLTISVVAWAGRRDATIPLPVRFRRRAEMAPATPTG